MAIGEVAEDLAAAAPLNLLTNPPVNRRVREFRRGGRGAEAKCRFWERTPFPRLAPVIWPGMGRRPQPSSQILLRVAALRPRKQKRRAISPGVSRKPVGIGKLAPVAKARGCPR